MQFVVLAQLESHCQTHAIVCFTLLCEPFRMLLLCNFTDVTMDLD